MGRCLNQEPPEQMHRQEPLQVVFMWGVDTWLNDPEWLTAGAQAMDILRAGP